MSVFRGDVALTETDVRRALDAVIDPELDEPITTLGFVQSVGVDDRRVEVHLRLPTAFCAPNFAYLMASDSRDALMPVAGDRVVIVELDDHHDSDIINRGLAADAGYRDTFGHEAKDSLDQLRTTFQRKAHTAAMERCLTAFLRANPGFTVADLGAVRIADLPDDGRTTALLRRRTAIGLRNHPEAPVLVDHNGTPCARDQIPLAVRLARTTRISIDGNSHFCRTLLRTRYQSARDGVS